MSCENVQSPTLEPSTSLTEEVTEPAICATTVFEEVNFEEEEEDNDNAIISQCGALVGKLHLDKFLCPGIHQICVEYNGKLFSRMISPKQFTIEAGKDKQKDWKGSIRIGRQTLRTLMEQKSLDFYQHETYCSGKCQSRNFLQRPFMIDDYPASQRDYSEPGYGISQSVDTNTALSSDVQAAVLLSHVNKMAMKNELADSSDIISSRNMISSDVPRNFLSNGDSPSCAIPSSSTSGESIEAVDSLMLTKPLQFWNSVHRLGIFEELIAEIVTNIEQAKVAFISNPNSRNQVSRCLSEVVRVLDLSETLQRRIQTKRILQKAETDILANELEELRRRAEDQMRRQSEARRKSQLFDQLFSGNTDENDGPPAKSPKLDVVNDDDDSNDAPSSNSVSL